MQEIQSLVGPILGIFILFIAFAYMVGGKKAAGAIIRGPFVFVGGLFVDLVCGVFRLGADLLGQGLRWVGRAIETGARRLFRLPPRRVLRRRGGRHGRP